MGRPTAGTLPPPDSWRAGRLATQGLFDGAAYFSRILHYPDTGCFQCLHFFVGGAFAAGDDCTGMTHAAPWRCRNAGDEADHRFLHVLLNELCGLFLRIAADF